MRKEYYNLDVLAHAVAPRTHKIADVQDKLVKVAFDVVRFVDGKSDELWQIDGEYIVALYDTEEAQLKVQASAPEWSATVKNSDIHVFYKGDYVTKVAGVDFGFEASDLELARRYLPETLASNKKLASSLLSSVNESVRRDLVAKYPELS